MCLSFYTAFDTRAACCIYVLRYFSNLLCSLFVLFCITKIQLIFDTPKFLSGFLSKNLTFFHRRHFTQKWVLHFIQYQKTKETNQHFKVLYFCRLRTNIHFVFRSFDTTNIMLLYDTAKYLVTFFSIKHTFNFYYIICLFFTYFEYFNYTYTTDLYFYINATNY